MDQASPPRHRYTGHEVHLVLVQECQRCGRHVVLRATGHQVAAYCDPQNAIAYAEQLRANLVGHPDPDPVLVVVAGDGSAESVPAEPAIASPGEPTS